MELHKENPFKTRSYSNAYLALRKWPDPLCEMTHEELSAIKGVGKNIADKIIEFCATGELQTYNKYADHTPPGIIDLLRVKGLGAKKIRLIWDELGVESIGELLYASYENRLVDLKGFGKKTQEDLIAKLEFHQQSQNKFHYGKVEEIGDLIYEKLEANFPEHRISRTGGLRRKDVLLEQFDFLVTPSLDLSDEDWLTNLNVSNGQLNFLVQDNYPVNIIQCEPDEFGTRLFETTGYAFLDDSFISAINDLGKNSDEDQIFAELKIPYLLPELRMIDTIPEDFIDKELITEDDIKGIVHAHTTYSDGMNSIKEMVKACKELGYEYFVLSDHSKSAFYANGLKEDRLEEQWAEVDGLNAADPDFKIFKSIESDILYDGSLDYDNNVLARFDLVIASVHSNLKMDEQTATKRLITAIENPYTHILGHMTGRLLLSRAGYPIDTKKVIDACAANNVSIELNANPYRLDIDYEYIPYALEKGIMISINPDAHSVAGIKDIRYGVLAARKGLLTKDRCLNANTAADFLKLAVK
jgi:DNA polymerase (family 10)